MTYRKLSALISAALAAMAVLILIGCSNGDPGLSRAEVEELVRSELAQSPPAPTAEPGLTTADVEEAVREAMEDMPQPEPGLSRAEVELIV